MSMFRRPWAQRIRTCSRGAAVALSTGRCTATGGLRGWLGGTEAAEVLPKSLASGKECTTPWCTCCCTGMHSTVFSLPAAKESLAWAAEAFEALKAGSESKSPAPNGARGLLIEGPPPSIRQPQEGHLLVPRLLLRHREAIARRQHVPRGLRIQVRPLAQPQGLAVRRHEAPELLRPSLLQVRDGQLLLRQARPQLLQLRMAGVRRT